MDLSGKTVVVFGMGRSGVAAAKLALSRGAHRVVGVDGREHIDAIEGVELQLGAPKRRTFVEADWLVVSPGIAAAHPEVVAAQRAGVQVVGELGFAVEGLDGVVVAVTGTNGKSTVTSFTSTLMGGEAAGVFAGGNLGVPLSQARLEGSHRAYVIEVSSYQLELPGSLAPDVAVVLNLTPDHLGRHGTMAEYGRTKAKLFARQPVDGWSFVPASQPELRGEGGPAQQAWMGALPGVVRDERTVTVQCGGDPIVLDLSGVTVPGAHNLDHAATAAALALAAGTSVDVVTCNLARLTALPHRMQPVADRDGIQWINDSKATNVEAASVGIEGLARRAVVLLGGQAKGPGFAALAGALGRHRAVLTFGASGGAIADELSAVGVEVERCGSLAEATTRAAALAQPGDAILLSPGCASFDAFDNFEHRGHVFASLAAGEAP